MAALKVMVSLVATLCALMLEMEPHQTYFSLDLPVELEMGYKPRG